MWWNSILVDPGFTRSINPTTVRSAYLAILANESLHGEFRCRSRRGPTGATCARPPGRGGNIASGIVPAALELRHLRAGEDGVESVAGSTRRAEEPFREVDRIDQCDRPGVESLLFAGRSQKLRVEAVAVVRYQHGIADEVGERS